MRMLVPSMFGHGGMKLGARIPCANLSTRPTTYEMLQVALDHNDPIGRAATHNKHTLLSTRYNMI